MEMAIEDSCKWEALTNTNTPINSITGSKITITNRTMAGIKHKIRWDTSIHIPAA
jgi:hypothetical protein